MQKKVTDSELDKQLENYNSHCWKRYISSSPGEPIEYVIECEDCGCYNYGDPVEMASIGGIDYPRCETIK